MRLDEIQHPKGQKTKIGPQDYKIFLDMDGVLVDFVKGAATLLGIEPNKFPSANRPKDKEFDNKLWSAVRSYEKAGNKFWLDLDPMPDFKLLWNYVKGYDPEILTATGDHGTATVEKNKWSASHLGKDIVVHTVNHSRDKGKYAVNNGILIDDRQRSIDAWVDGGGIGILHKNAGDTIKQLKKLGL